MKVHGLAWIGSSSPRLDEMTRLLRDRLGLELEREQSGARVFRFPDGSGFEVFKPDDTAHDFFEHPVAGLLVDDVREVRAHLEADGIEFLGEPYGSTGTASGCRSSTNGHTREVSAGCSSAPAMPPSSCSTIRSGVSSTMSRPGGGCVAATAFV